MLHRAKGFSLWVNSERASPEVSADPRFLDKLIIFSGWLIFITNPLDQMNTNALEEQIALKRSPADKAMH